VKKAARTVWIGATANAAQPAHNVPNQLSAGRRSTILPPKPMSPQIHKL
jgi:hypothetical protein